MVRINTKIVSTQKKMWQTNYFAQCKGKPMNYKKNGFSFDLMKI